MNQYRVTVIFNITNAEGTMETNLQFIKSHMESFAASLPNLDKRTLGYMIKRLEHQELTAA